LQSVGQHREGHALFECVFEQLPLMADKFFRRPLNFDENGVLPGQSQAIIHATACQAVFRSHFTKVVRIPTEFSKYWQHRALSRRCLVKAKFSFRSADSL